MFISTRKHLAIIKEIRTYWSNELYKARTENARLTAQLEAMSRPQTAPDTPLPAPLPAVERRKYVIVHIVSANLLRTLCNEYLPSLAKRNTAHFTHLVATTGPQKTKLKSGESWCADCLG